MNVAMQHNVHNSHMANKDGSDLTFFDVAPLSLAEHEAKQAADQAKFDAKHKQKAKKSPSPPMNLNKPRASFETETTFIGELESKGDMKQGRTSPSILARLTGNKKSG